MTNPLQLDLSKFPKLDLSNYKSLPQSQLAALGERGGLFAAAYQERADKLKATYYTFRLIHQEVAKLVKDAKTFSSEAQTALEKLITEDIKANAPTRAPDSLHGGQTAHILNYTVTFIDKAVKSAKEAGDKHKGAADGIDEKKEQIKQETEKLEKNGGADKKNTADPTVVRLNGEIDRLKGDIQSQKNTIEKMQNSAANNAERKEIEKLRAAAAAEDRERDLRRQLEEAERRAREANSGRNGSSGGLGQLGASLGPLLAQVNAERLRAEQVRTQQLIAAQAAQAAQARQFSVPQVAPAAGLGGLAALGPLLSSGFAANRGGFDAGRNDLLEERAALREQRAELQRERDRLLRDQADRNRNSAVPRVTPAPATTPATTTTPAPTVQPAGPPAGQPANNAPPAPGAAAERKPDEDGLVLYTFPDGRQQRVLPVVAEALDVALNDNAGTNAQAAYADTPAKWDDDKEIGKRIDPNQLMTGAVVGFEDTTALAVVWGSPDSGGTLELVVNGKLVPFNPESKEFEALGPFVGFFHPDIGQGAPTGGVRGVVATSPGADNLAGAPA